ncbi:hypothetical protein HPB51_005647 [Rhipicephalus microplus]|uniref:Uncharacterized protein n=1 Tax=Rhipicephalus microplus TaxID=6941 RepID=A0A9J6ELS4_RHIMP|nr:hypothetical protein HPB51_005647 [Rhipicephalus microplus]
MRASFRFPPIHQKCFGHLRQNYCPAAQLLDECQNRDHIMRSQVPEVSCGCLKQASLAMLCRRTTEAWVCILKVLVHRTLKNCSIGSTLDGSEDEVLRQDTYDELLWEQHVVLTFSNRVKFHETLRVTIF